MRTSSLWFAIACGFAGSVIACGAAVADSSPDVAPAQPGVWQQHRYSFAFLGFTSTYSCDGLADKLKLLLLESGARPDVKATAGACANGFGRPDKFARADLTFYTLAPAGDATAPNTPVINGSWRAVAFAQYKPRDLGLGDCELVEQFRANVLPLFTTRHIDAHTTCVPNQDSGSVIDLRYEAFAAMPAPDAKTTHAGR